MQALKVNNTASEKDARARISELIEYEKGLRRELFALEQQRAVLCEKITAARKRRDVLERAMVKVQVLKAHEHVERKTKAPALTKDELLEQWSKLPASELQKVIAQLEGMKEGGV